MLLLFYTIKIVKILTRCARRQRDPARQEATIAAYSLPVTIFNKFYLNHWISNLGTNVPFILFHILIK